MERSAMTKRKLAVKILGCCALFAVIGAHGAQEKRGAETMVARGPFDVKMAPVDTAHKEEKAIARYSLDKTYHGDLEGTGTGELLASMGDVKGSGTYGAMEDVNGTLPGKKGTLDMGRIAPMTQDAQ